MTDVIMYYNLYNFNNCKLGWDEKWILVEEKFD